jgi:hypothetical protein
MTKPKQTFDRQPEPHKQKSLVEIGEDVKKFFKDGMSDEQIAEKLDLAVNHVQAVRSLTSLHKRIHHSIFVKSLKLRKDAKNRFFVTFSIPNDIEEKIGLEQGGDYQVFAHAIGKGKIELQITEEV